MNREQQIDIITDLLIDFDEMGFAPTTACPDPEAYAVEWKRKITEAFEKVCKQSEGEWIVKDIFDEVEKCVIGIIEPSFAQLRDKYISKMKGGEA